MSSNRKSDREEQPSSKKPGAERLDVLNVPLPADSDRRPGQPAGSGSRGGRAVDQERGQRDAPVQENPFTKGKISAPQINPFSPRGPLSSQPSNPFASGASPHGNPFMEGTRPEPPRNPFTEGTGLPVARNPFADVWRSQPYNQRVPSGRSGSFPPPADSKQGVLAHKVDSDRDGFRLSRALARQRRKTIMRLRMKKVTEAAEAALDAMKRAEDESDKESGKGSASSRPANPSKSDFEELVKVVICGNCGKPNHKLHLCPGPVESDGCVAGCPLHNTKQHSLDDCRPSWDVPEETIFRMLISRRAGLPPLRTTISWPQLAVANAEKGLRAIPVAAFPLTRGYSRLVPEELVQRYSVNNPSIKQLGVDPRTHTYADLFENIDSLMASERERPAIEEVLAIEEEPEEKPESKEPVSRRSKP